MNDNTGIIAVAGMLAGTIGSLSPEVFTQWIGALSAALCAIITIIRTVTAISHSIKHRNGEKSTDDLLKDLYKIRKDLEDSSNEKK